MKYEAKMWIDIVPGTESEVEQKFLQGMADRMAVSFFKYGRFADAYPTKVDAIASLEKRLALFKETGNTEWLLDVANFAMIEFARPRHPAAHFRPTDAAESPGRVIDGRNTPEANTAGHARGIGSHYKREGD